MCWYCEQIDKKIEHYRGLSVRVTDERSVKSLDILIAALQARKNQLHPAGSEEPEDQATTAPPR
jgi:hypothetical protein